MLYTVPVNAVPVNARPGLGRRAGQKPRWNRKQKFQSDPISHPLRSARR